MIVPLAEADPRTCGGKAGALGVLVRAGIPVPDGFVLPFGSRQEDLPGAVTRGLELLGDGPVAVRSSASNEDTETSSAAGRYASVLAVRGVDRVADAVRTCWASLRSLHAVDHPSRTESEGDDDDGDGAGTGMAVLVQRLVDADVSGVMFTPTTRDSIADEPTRIEAAWGLGPAVVGGTVTPDSYRIDGHGTVSARVADKRTRLDREGGRIVSHPVSKSCRTSPTLDDVTARRLAELGGVLADLLGAAQDVEWALADGCLWILQARPITAPLPTAAAPPGNGAAGSVSGTPGSQGIASGPARIVRGPADFSGVRPHDILVCPYTDPAWTPLLRIVAGVVTETGGVLSHAAIVARECGIPAVLGVDAATARLPEGATITIDGRLGTVTLNA